MTISSDNGCDLVKSMKIIGQSCISLVMLFTMLSLSLAGCGPKGDPRENRRAEFIGCMKREDYGCIVRLTSKEERDAIGFTDETKAQQFIRDAFHQLQVQTKADPSVETVGVGSFPVHYPYRTPASPNGRLSFFIDETDEGPVARGLYFILVLMLATEEGLRGGYASNGPDRHIARAKFFREQGAELNRKYGMKGYYDLTSMSLKTWEELAAESDVRASRAQQPANSPR